MGVWGIYKNCSGGMVNPKISDYIKKALELYTQFVYGLYVMYYVYNKYNTDTTHNVHDTHITYKVIFMVEPGTFRYPKKRYCITKIKPGM